MSRLSLFLKKSNYFLKNLLLWMAFKIFNFSHFILSFRTTHNYETWLTKYLYTIINLRQSLTSKEIFTITSKYIYYGEGRKAIENSAQLQKFQYLQNPLNSGLCQSFRRNWKFSHSNVSKVCRKAGKSLHEPYRYGSFILGKLSSRVATSSKTIRYP